MITLITILIVTILFFIWGRFSSDLVAVGAMLSLYLFGVLGLSDTLSGFSNPTVIMIGALFVLGESLSKTGWTALAGRWFIKMAGNSKNKLLLIIVSGAAGLSGFVSNTGTVATLLPVTVATAWKMGALPSQFLIPLAFGANTGGLLTLTGTPPNIIANNALIEAGFDGFFFFEFALIGIPLLIVALLYLRFVLNRLLPQHRTNNQPIDFDSTIHDWIAPYGLEEGNYKLRVRSNSPILNQSIAEADLENRYNVMLLHVEKNKAGRYFHWLPRRYGLLSAEKGPMEKPEPYTIFERNDLIVVKGSTEAVNKLILDCHLALRPVKLSEAEIKEGLFDLEFGVAEIIVTPRSEYLKKRLRVGEFFQQYNLQLLAASRRNNPINESEIIIRQGDSFLVRGTWKDISALEDEKRNFIVCGSTDQFSKEVTKLNYKSWLSLAALFLMIGLMVFKVVPGVIAALIAASLPVIARAMTPKDAYRSVSWGSVILIAAMIPMSSALQQTGVATLAANALVNSLGNMGPIYLLGGIFLLTAMLSQFINNSATAVLMAPIAIQACIQQNISPEPAMIMVAASASTAFLTPIGTTTNAMVFSAGGYTFGDYFKVGSILLLLFFVTCLILVPMFWPI